MPDVKNIFVFELSTAQAQSGLNDAYSPSTVLSNSPKEMKDWQQKSSVFEKCPKSLIINWLCLGSNTAQNIAYYTFLFQCTYISRKPLASRTLQIIMLFTDSLKKKFLTSGYIISNLSSLVLFFENAQANPA